MPLTEAELKAIEEQVKQIPVLETELKAAIKRADDARGAWGNGPEARIKDLEAQLKTATGARDEFEKRLNARFDEVEVRMNRPGAADAKAGRSPVDAKTMKAFGEYLRKGTQSPDLVAVDKEGKTLQTNDGTLGGFLIPEPVRLAMIEELVDISPIRANAQSDTISSDAAEVPVDDGSFSAGWTSETGARTATGTPTFTLRRIPLREQYAFPKATQKMLDDASFNIEQYVGRKLAEKFAQLENRAFVLGNNVDEPEGIAVNTEIATVNSGHASEVTADGLLNLLAEMPTSYAAGASLFMRRQTLFSLRKLKDDNKQYLWQPSLQAGQPSTFAGVPVIEAPDVAAVAANAKAIIYGNLRRGYQIVDKSTVGLLRDPYTDKPNVGFYSTRRTGGRVVLPAAIKIQKIAA